MRNWQKIVLFLLVVAFAVAIASVTSIKLLEPKVKVPPVPLKKYILMFPSGDTQDLLADEVRTLSPCNILYIKGKPILYICTPHILFPPGPVKLTAEEPIPDPDPLRAPSQNLIAEFN